MADWNAGRWDEAANDWGAHSWDEAANDWGARSWDATWDESQRANPQGEAQELKDEVKKLKDEVKEVKYFINRLQDAAVGMVERKTAFLQTEVNNLHMTISEMQQTVKTLTVAVLQSQEPAQIPEPAQPPQSPSPQFAQPSPQPPQPPVPQPPQPPQPLRQDPAAPDQLMLPQQAPQQGDQLAVPNQLQLAVPNVHGFVHQRHRRPCIYCRDPHNQAVKMIPGSDSGAIKWLWGNSGRIREVYASQISMMDVISKDGILQSMRDSPLFTVAQGEFMEKLFLGIEEGVREGSLECGWHRTKSYITILLQCPSCQFTAGAEIYTKGQVNTGVTQNDYHTLQQVLAAMVGINVGPAQGV